MCSTDTATSRNPQLFSSLGPSCVHAGVRPLLIALGLLVWTGAGAGCGRTALEPIYKDTVDAGAPDHPLDLPAERMDAPPDVPPDLSPDLSIESPPDMRPDLPGCVPKV